MLDVHWTDWETSQTAYVNLALDIHLQMTGEWTFWIQNYYTETKEWKRRKEKLSVKHSWVKNYLYLKFTEKKCKMYKKVYNLQKVKQKKCII